MDIVRIGVRSVEDRWKQKKAYQRQLKVEVVWYVYRSKREANSEV